MRCVSRGSIERTFTVIARVGYNAQLDTLIVLNVNYVISITGFHAVVQTTSKLRPETQSLCRMTSTL